MSMRTILHSDANCFYASVEMLLNPSLRGKAVAVCGSEDDRHGIVLAKSEQAKRAGVKTGQANWEARQACPGLICVPPRYEQYNKFSILLRNIYLRYTDLVEPYGIGKVRKRRASGRSITIGVHRKEEGAYYATPVEYGHGGPAPAPAHPFIRPAYDTRQDEAYEIIRDGLRDAIDQM